MGLQAFLARKPRHVIQKARVQVTNLQPRAHAQEVQNRQPSPRPGCAAGGEYVVWSHTVIPDHLGAALPHEQRSVVTEALRQALGILNRELDQARAVGERLSAVLGKRVSGLDVYISLFGPTAGRAEAADSVLSWPRASRPDPDSPVLMYEFNLIQLLAHAGADDQAVEVMRYEVPNLGSLMGTIRADVALMDFNCRADVRALYERAGLKNQESCGPGE